MIRHDAAPTGVGSRFRAGTGPTASGRSRRLGGILLILALAVPALSAGPALAQKEGLLGADAVMQGADDEETRAKIARLEKQVPLSSENYRGHYDLANAYQDVHMPTEAEARYRRALEINPEFTEAMVNLGGLLTDLSRNEEAIELFEKALAVDPEDCKARSNLGNAYYAMSRFADAMYEYRRAVDIDPKCYPALFNIGVAFADAGIFREAVSWWRKVVEVAPGTDAGRQARDNIELLRPFTESPVPPPPVPGNDR